MVDDWYYIVRGPSGNIGTARTQIGANALAQRWEDIGRGPCTIEMTSPALERAGRNVAFALALVSAMWQERHRCLEWAQWYRQNGEGDIRGLASAIRGGGHASDEDL